MKIIKTVVLCAGIVLSFTSFANNLKPISCNLTSHFEEVKEQIAILDPTFSWEGRGCQMIATQSIFPKKNNSGTKTFVHGLQLFIYQNQLLKFVCLPGWVCKKW